VGGDAERHRIDNDGRRWARIATAALATAALATVVLSTVVLATDVLAIVVLATDIAETAVHGTAPLAPHTSAALSCSGGWSHGGEIT